MEPSVFVFGGSQVMVFAVSEYSLPVLIIVGGAATLAAGSMRKKFEKAAR